MAAHTRQVGHAHLPFAVLIDQRQPRQARFVAVEADPHLVQQARVDFQDDLEMARQHPGKQRQRPLLQRLGQQRVVGVGKGILRDVPGLVPG
ncbi:hypothetical protein D3C87_1929020 [compost metagenome]